MLILLLEALLEILSQLAVELLLWSMGVRWIIFTLFAIATIICYLSRLYVISGLAGVTSLMIAVWPVRRRT